MLCPTSGVRPGLLEIFGPQGEVRGMKGDHPHLGLYSLPHSLGTYIG